MDDPKIPKWARSLSLRWKAFAALLLLLGLVHGFFGLVLYRELLRQHDSEQKAELAAHRLVLEGLLEQSAQSLQRIAAQLGSTVSVESLKERPFDPEMLAPELLANLSSVRIFDAEGRPLARHSFAGNADVPPEVEAALLARVRKEHRPTTVLVCGRDCDQVVYEPAFDRDGDELVISAGQSVAEAMQVFAQQTSADIALLSTGDAAPAATAEEGIWKRRVYAVTHAPTLLPILRGLAAKQAIPASGIALAADEGSAKLILLRFPLAGAAPAPVDVLLILDTTADQAKILATVRGALIENLVALILSALALWLFLTPVARRLRRISQALPLLAEQQFAAARDMLGAPDTAPWFADEIDRLAAAALRLSHRLQALNSAEAASAEKTLYLATMVHEVRTPLNGIFGVLELLEHSNLDADQRNSIRMVRESAQSLLHLLDDSLDLARIEAGRIDLDTAAFSIEDVLEGCVETLAARARPKQLKLISHVDPALPKRVLGDAMRLRQILHNLCSNAIKFTASGRVVIRAQRDARPGPGVWVRFSVADTGVGIPPEARKHLFERFRQADASTASRFGGSGLGLSICRGLVQRMGGSIDFDSEPGRGSEFHVLLEFQLPDSSDEPAAEPLVPTLQGLRIAIRLAAADEASWLAEYLEAAGARIDAEATLALLEEAGALKLRSLRGVVTALHEPVSRASLVRAVAQAAGRIDGALPDAAAASSSRRLRVLAVDDHPTNRLVIERQLSLLGHEVCVASGGQEGLRLLAEAPFDLVLTDLQMPQVNGYALLQEIRRRQASGLLGAQLPVLLVTAQAGPGVAERCREAGFDAFLTKPLSLVQLRQALRPWSAPTPGDELPTARTDTAVDAAVDTEFLRELIGDDPALGTQLVKEFLRINEPLFDELAATIERADFKALASQAHRLLGSAMTTGAKPLARLLAALEQAATRELREECTLLMQRAQIEFQRVRAYAASTAIG